MDNPLFDYIPPEREKRQPFSLRLDSTEQARLILWAQTEGVKHDARERAVAARHGLNEWLDSKGIPRSKEEIERRLHELRYGQQRKVG